MSYENYKPYHLPLTQEQDAEIDRLTQERPEGPVDQGYEIQHNRVVMNDPLLNAYARFAYRRADEELQGIDIPMIPVLHRDYPGIDPKGKHCRKDMDFAQRAARLESAAKACDPAIKNAVDSFLRQCKIPSTRSYDLAERVDAACKEIQHNEYASKVCIATNVQGILAQQAKQIEENDPDIQKMDKILTAMEQVTGLRGGSLDPQTIAEYNDLNPFAPLNAALPTGIHVKRTSPETLAVNFQNFDNIVMQEYYADPENARAIASGSIPKEPTNLEALDGRMDRYAAATATNALDGLFKPLEQYSSKTPLSAHRATLVIVDGKTVSEHMQEIYNGLKDKPKFDTWYADNLEKMSGKIVAAGLMSGKRVEAFIPGPDGKLPDQPTVLHRTGYEPSPLKPVTMNAWERFFSKFGFYKGKAAKADEYKAFSDARERLKATYVAAQTNRMSNTKPLMKDMFFGAYLRENNIPDLQTIESTLTGSSRLSRGSGVAACACLMAAMGHDIRDIMDPTKLVQEKADVGKLYMQHLLMDPNTRQPAATRANRTGDKRWLGSVFFHGHRALRKQINDIMSKTDLNDTAQRQAVLPTLSYAVQCMFDGYQDVTVSDGNNQAMVGYFLAAEQDLRLKHNVQTLNGAEPVFGTATEDGAVPAKLMKDAAKDLVNQTLDELSKVSSFMDGMREGDWARATLAQPFVTTYGLAHAPQKLVYEKAMMDLVNPNEKLPFTSRLPSFDSHVGLNDINQDFSDLTKPIQITRTSPDWQKTSKAIVSGEFAEVFAVNNSNTRAHTSYITSYDMVTNEAGQLTVTKAVDRPRTKVVAPHMTISTEKAAKLGFNVQIGTPNRQAGSPGPKIR